MPAKRRANPHSYMNADGLEKYFGEAVKNRRLKLNLSQTELARRAGLQRTYLADVERGARNIGIQNVLKLASALGVPVASLLPPR